MPAVPVVLVRRPLAALATAAALLALAAPGAAAAPAPATGCADRQLVVVRGTGEQGVLSVAFTALTRDVTERAGRTVQTVGLPYPATDDWSNSANAGIGGLAAHLREEAARCPAMRFGLLGYSQGAWVIGDALAGGGGAAAPQVDRALGAKVDAVVMYGDPRFRAGEPFDAGSHAAGSQGLIPRDPGALQAYASRIRSWCDADDGICQNGADGDGHFGYWDAYTGDATRFLLERLDLPDPAPSTPAATTPPPAAAGAAEPEEGRSWWKRLTCSIFGCD